MNSWLKKSLALYSANGLNFLLNLTIIPIIIYYIDFQGYGFYSIYIIISSTLLFLDSALSKSAVSTIYSEKEEQRAKLISSCQAAYIILGIVLLLTTHIIAKGISVLFPLSSGQLDLAYWIGAAATAEYALALPGQYFQMLNVLRARHFTYAQYQLCIQLSRFFTVAIVAAMTHQIEWVLAAIVIRKLPDYLILWLFWRHQEAEPRTPIAWPLVATLYRLATPIIGVALVQVLTTEFISIYISHTYGAETLGKYRSIYDVLNKIWFVATLYPVMVYPKICEWLIDAHRKAWLRGMLPYLILGSTLIYGTLTLAGLAIYPLMTKWFPTLQDTTPFVAGLLAGICMSGHARLGYEFLQAQKNAGVTLLINFLSLGAGAVTLFAFYGCATKEIGWAWIASQLLAVAIVDIRNGILLSSSIRKLLLGLLPWFGVGIAALLTTSTNNQEVAVITLTLLSLFMISLAFLAKALYVSRSVKCTE